MTTRAHDLATKYVRQSVETQARLGYRRPPRAVVEDAVADAERALEKLLRLQQRVAARP